MIIDFKDLPAIREKYRGKTIVFSSGTFDLTHAGHALFFEDCKTKGDVLMVMVGNDALIKRYKGNERPILNENIRLKMVDSLKPVDYSFLDYDHSEDQYFGCVEDAFEKLQPDVWVVNDDGRDIPVREKIAARYGVKLIIFPRTAPKEFENISTTSIIKKIKKGANA